MFNFIFWFYTVGNVTLGGYREIKIGALKSEIEPLLKELENAPSYAWFAPMTFETTARTMMELEGTLTAEDSSYVLEVMEEMFSYDEESFIDLQTDKDHERFVGGRITALSLMYDEQNTVSSV